MSTTQGSYITAADFINLKNRVKNEMARRNGYGDLSSYSGVAYDYTVAPATGGTVKQEHYGKIRDVMAQINSAKVGLAAKSAGDAIPAMTVLEGNMTSFEAQPRYATTNNDCASNCSGVCVITCSTGCNSTCTGTCTGACSSCTGTCTGTCSSCTGTCTGTCTEVCNNSCTGCDSTCRGSCDSTCKGCSGTCSGTCGGCSGDCSGDCYNSCSSICSIMIACQWEGIHSS